ncbi:MAG: carboxypeptidase-like regulatory domain-containing protein [Candidatus Kapaibacterium sp.]
MLRAISIPLFIIIFSFLHASAQDTTGTVSGRVTDDSGKPRVGANVIVLGTTPLRGAVVKADGSYVIAGIKPGEYRIEMRYLGFERERKSGVLVRSGEVADVRFVMRLKRDEEYGWWGIPAIRFPAVVIGKCGTAHSITAYDLDPGLRASDIGNR